MYSLPPAALFDPILSFFNSPPHIREYLCNSTANNDWVIVFSQKDDACVAPNLLLDRQGDVSGR
jgi:hypothetical protein